MDPHRNIFFYYAGTAKAVGGRDRQLEDNTTKALVNLLELTANGDPEGQLTQNFIAYLEVSTSDSGAPDFALQRSTIGEIALARAKDKLLLGIAPKVDGNVDLPEVGDQSSRPDAWIWLRDAVVCVETKVVGTFDPKQLAAHANTLGAGARQSLLTWRNVYGFFADQLAAALETRPTSLTTVLLGQFIEYLRIIAYRQEINMGEFDGFRPEHFAAFTFRDREDTKDNQRRVKHYLGQFVSAVREELPASLSDFGHQQVGNLKADASHSWSTLSRGKKPVHEAHFSFAVGSDDFAVRLLLEGLKPTKMAKRAISERPERFLEILEKLGDWRIRVRRRWQVQPRKFKANDACVIELDSVRQIDVNYVLVKMNDLERKLEGQGFFMIIVERSFEIGDPAIGKKAFAGAVASMLEDLIPLERFLSRAE